MYVLIENWIFKKKPTLHFSQSNEIYLEYIATLSIK